MSPRQEPGQARLIGTTCQTPDPLRMLGNASADDFFPFQRLVRRRVMTNDAILVGLVEQIRKTSGRLVVRGGHVLLVVALIN